MPKIFIYNVFYKFYRSSSLLEFIYCSKTKNKTTNESLECTLHKNVIIYIKTFSHFAVYWSKDFTKNQKIQSMMDFNKGKCSI